MVSAEAWRGFVNVVTILIVVAGLGYLAIVMCGCGASTQERAEMARVVACQGAEEVIERRCQPDCGPTDFARIDGVRLACDAMHAQLVQGEE